MRATVVLTPSGVTLRRWAHAKLIDGAPVICAFHKDAYDSRCEACKAIIRSSVLLEERAAQQAVQA